MFDILPNRSTVMVLVSALLAVLPVIAHASLEVGILSVLARGMHVGDMLFHEMGHAIFSWLFGIPAVPMILTLFGADQAGGYTLMLSDRHWVMQGVALLVLLYGCIRLKQEESSFFLPMLILTGLIVALCLTPYYNLLIFFMGHGSSILMGGFFLYRGILDLDARHAFERWLNAFFGFYLILANGYFAFGLAFDAAKRAAYSQASLFGAGHHDFVEMVQAGLGWSVTGIALFTLAYACLTLIGAFVLSAWRR